MAHEIIYVEPGSPAARAGIMAGDALLAIDGERIIDFIDYQALCAHTRLDIATRAGKFHIKKPRYADLGLRFESDMMSRARLCVNNCAFCFVDQLPDCARASLRVKDDDWRMSLMMGNYVSLTNVSDVELDRIIRRHASPLYISAHAMDPILRAEMMGSPRAKQLPEQLQKLAEGGIAFHAQAVLCPGVNDAFQLENTISELVKLRPACLSLALVPVGLTAHRSGLSELRKYSRAEARAVIEIADKWRARLHAEIGTRFVFPSDEFYLTADIELPSDAEYEDYQQLDDGVGMLRLFEAQYVSAWEDAEYLPLVTPKKIALACGKSAYDFFLNLVGKYEIPGARVEVIAIPNRFFGSDVTVSGLLTGSDILSEMRGKRYKHILISQTTLRDGAFLDDMTLSELEAALAARVIPVGRDGGDLVRAIMQIAES